MSLIRSRAAVSLALGGLAVAAAAGLVPGASAATTTTTTYSSSCFAQLLSLSLGGTDIPVDSGRSCDDPGDSFFPTDTIVGPAQFPLAVDVVYEHTARSADQSQAQARAGVAHVFLPLSVPSGGQLPDITVDVLTSQSTCKNGVADSSSHVVGLDVGGQKVELPGDITGSPIDLSPLAFIELNKQDPSHTSSDTGAGTNPRVQTTTNGVTQTALHVVVLPGAAPGPADVVDLAIARTSASCTTTVTTTSTGNPPPPPADKDGWMNGGGTMVDSSTTSVDPGTQVSHGFVLPCHATQAPPPGGTNLVVNGDFGHFKLSAVTDAHCTDDPNQGDPENPKAGFNTMDGSGSGTCNGEPATVRYHYTDEGEPNTADEATLHIRGGCTLDVVGILTNGNNQAHPLSGGGSSASSKKH